MAVVASFFLCWFGLMEARSPDADLSVKSVRRDGAQFDTLLDLTCRISGFRWTCRYLDLSGSRLSGDGFSKDEKNSFSENIVNYGGGRPAIDLSGRSLRFAVFDGAQMVSANLRGVDARRGNFSYANMRGVDLSGADIGRAAMVEANLKESRLFSVEAGGVDFYKSNMEGAILILSSIYGSNMKNVNLKNANLTSAVIMSTDIILANMDNVEAVGAIFYNSNIYFSRMTNSNFIAANFDNVIGIKMSDLTKSDFSGASFMNVDFRGSIVDRVNFHSANLYRSDFSGARGDFLGCDDAVLPEEKIDGINNETMNEHGSILDEYSRKYGDMKYSEKSSSNHIRCGREDFSVKRRLNVSKFVSSRMDIACRGEDAARGVISSSIPDHYVLRFTSAWNKEGCRAVRKVS